MPRCQIAFLSLFVDDLEAATQRYKALLGIEPTAEISGSTAPAPHPFAGEGPVLFDLGGVKLALYSAAPNRGTHVGDVGIGLMTGDTLQEHANRIRHAGCAPLGPSVRVQGGRTLSVVMPPDRHFFEFVLQEQPTPAP